MTMFKLNLWSTRRAIVIGTVMAFGLGAVNSAQSQEFPKKEIIKIIVPYAAGGPTDTVARLLIPHMQKALKQTVIIENRTGAGSAIGARVVASARPDGYTILIGNVSTFAIAPAVMKHPGYDPTKAFAPIVQTSDIGNVLVVRPDFPANTVRELVAYAKANPGKLSYGSAGVGNSAHLMFELLKVKSWNRRCARALSWRRRIGVCRHEWTSANGLYRSFRVDRSHSQWKAESAGDY